MCPTIPKKVPTGEENMAVAESIFGPHEEWPFCFNCENNECDVDQEPCFTCLEGHGKPGWKRSGFKPRNGEMPDLLVTVKLEAGYGFGGMTEAEAISEAMKSFLSELREGKGIEKLSITVDKVG